MNDSPDERAYPGSCSSASFSSPIPSGRACARKEVFVGTFRPQRSPVGQSSRPDRRYEKVIVDPIEIYVLTGNGLITKRHDRNVRVVHATPMTIT